VQFPKELVCTQLLGKLMHWSPILVNPLGQTTLATTQSRVAGLRVKD